MATAEVKNTQIQIRVSQSEKDAVTEFCKKHGLIMSNFIREAIAKEMYNIRHNRKDV
jgi:predicted DNA binding CopG/RHH family protein